MATQPEWLDISIPMRSGMIHWPGDPEPTFERVSEIEQGSVANVTLCRMSAHTGTHMDAPCHFLPVPEGMDTFPLDVGIGPVRVIQFPNDVRAIGQAELQEKGIGRGERVLFKTRNSSRVWQEEPFDRGFVAISASGAGHSWPKQAWP